ncbi:MAG: sigma-54-dependent Fis family transcriptional regulator [Planctomycetes bacterium]|nr:sigma-54-dependent Fis family transcriptional regulator [Planctomycetota bacterium]
METQKIIRESELRSEYTSVAESLKRESRSNQILGRSKAVQALREKIDKISFCKVNVLISGESGTGKEIAARAIHYLSHTAGKPFIPVNCGAIPESLFENELFGHKKGAFTDAGLQQIGLVKEAEGGTLFLDEIGVITPYIQAKLLRLLQDKEYRPVGDSKRHKADVRIIAATNTDLQSLVEQGTFRKDLFYRLNVVSLHIPPLNERMEDIPILVKHFINRYSIEYDKPIEGLSKDTMKAFMSYSWPGNIRELENKIQQIIVMSTTPVIDVEDIHLPISNPSSKGSELEDFNSAKKRIVYSFAKKYLTQLLTEEGGDVVSAAKRAGKSRTGLWNLLKKFNIIPGKFH